MNQEITYYVNEQQRSYDLEQKKQKSRLIMMKENEFAQVKRIINSKYKDLHQMEFDTIFKMYKIQHYSLTPQLFEGSSYKYGTLSAIRSMVKAATKGIKNYSTGNTSYMIVYNFIQDVKKYSKPFPFLFEGRKNALDLIKSGTLTTEEKEFLTEKICSYRPEVTKEDREKLFRTHKKESEKKIMKPHKKAKLSMEEKEKIFSTIVNNYMKPISVVKSLVASLGTDINLNTVTVYTSACRRLAQGIKCNSHLNKMFIDIWNKRNNVLNTSLKNNNKTNTMLEEPNNTTLKELYVVMDGNELLKTASSVEFLRGFIAGMNEAHNNSGNLKIYKITEVLD